MPNAPKWRRYLRFWRPDPEADVDDELRTHLELRTAELAASGASATAAHAQALREFGDVEATRARLYEIDRRMTRRHARFLWWDAARADVRYALRGLRGSPLLTATVVLALALGIGAATTMYGVMRRLLVQPPPHVAAPERVARVFLTFTPQEGEARTFSATSYPFLERLRAEARGLAGVAAYMSGQTLPVGRGTDAAMVPATLVSAGFWRTLGVAPLHGRFVTDEEAHPATGARVVVLGHGFWQRRFGGDPGAVGGTLHVRGEPYRIVGIAPRGFRGVELTQTDLWLPLFAYDENPARSRWWEGSFNLTLVARRGPGVAGAAAEAELSRQLDLFTVEDARRRFRQDADTTVRREVRLGALTGALGHDGQPIPESRVAVWLVGVAFVLLAIACANVAGLLLLRALRRRREIAVRLALGMSRRRLAALLFTESGVLALLGGTVALVVAVAGGAWVQRVLLPDVASESAGTDWAVPLLALGCMVAVLILTGLGPVLHVRGDGTGGLRDGGQHGAARRSRLHGALLVAQTALSAVLLVGAGLFLRSLDRIASLDLGLDPWRVTTVQVAFEGSGRPRREVVAFYERALERVRAVPGVQQASLAVGIPLRGARGSSVRLPGWSEWLQTEQGSQSVNYVSDDFFSTTGMRIVQGRPITAADRTGPAVVVVNEALARRVWGGRSPIGECLHTSSQRELCATVVGVVGNARTFRLRGEEQRLWFYKPLAPDDVDDRVLLVRAAPAVRGLEATVRRAVQEMEPGLPYVDVRQLADVLDPQIRPWRIGAVVFTAFGLLAVLLASIGLYGSLAYAVTQRTREIGVRVAVGATARDVTALVVGDGLRVALAGVAAGLLAALVAGRWLADLLFETSPRDAAVLATVAATLLGVAVLASLLPARRAARVDPTTALRAD